MYSLAWQAKQSRGVPRKVPPTWQAWQSAAACAPLSGQAEWTKPLPAQDVGWWQRAQSAVPAQGDVVRGLRGGQRVLMAKPRKSTGAGWKMPASLPGWHSQQLAAMCAPTSGKRVAACSATSPTGRQSRSSWQREQSVTERALVEVLMAAGAATAGEHRHRTAVVVAAQALGLLVRAGEHDAGLGTVVEGEVVAQLGPAAGLVAQGAVAREGVVRHHRAATRLPLVRRHRPAGAGEQHDAGEEVQAQHQAQLRAGVESQGGERHQKVRCSHRPP